MADVHVSLQAKSGQQFELIMSFMSWQLFLSSFFILLPSHGALRELGLVTPHTEATVSMYMSAEQDWSRSANRLYWGPAQPDHGNFSFHTTLCTRIPVVCIAVLLTLSITLHNTPVFICCVLLCLFVGRASGTYINVAVNFTKVNFQVPSCTIYKHSPIHVSKNATTCCTGKTNGPNRLMYIVSTSKKVKLLLYNIFNDILSSLLFGCPAQAFSYDDFQFHKQFCELQLNSTYANSCTLHYITKST